MPVRILLSLTVLLFGGKAYSQDLTRLAGLMAPSYTAKQYSIHSGTEKGKMEPQPIGLRGYAAAYAEYVDSEAIGPLNPIDAHETRQLTSDRARANVDGSIHEHISGKDAVGQSLRLSVWCARLGKEHMEHDEAHDQLVMAANEARRRSRQPESRMTMVVSPRPKKMHLGVTERNSADGVSPEEFREIVSVVYQRCQKADFRIFFAALRLVQLSKNCIFRQAPARLNIGKGGILALNVPDNDDGGIEFILLFHIARDMGEVYIVSMNGRLERGCTRADGQFVESGSPDLDESFRIDFGFWIRIFFIEATTSTLKILPNYNGLESLDGVRLMRIIGFGFIAILFLPNTGTAQRVLDAHQETAVLSEPAGISEHAINEIARVVKQNGKIANLESLCAEMELDHVLDDCLFRQFIIFLNAERDEIIAFNVPKEMQPIPFVIAYHLNRKGGEIYLVSMSGNMVKGYLRNSDGAFSLDGSSRIKERFLMDMSFWAQRIDYVYERLGEEKRQ